jgi:hypothetical protein
MLCETADQRTISEEGACDLLTEEWEFEVSTRTGCLILSESATTCALLWYAGGVHGVARMRRRDAEKSKQECVLFEPTRHSHTTQTLSPRAQALRMACTWLQTPATLSDRVTKQLSQSNLIVSSGFFTVWPLTLECMKIS